MCGIVVVYKCKEVILERKKILMGCDKSCYLIYVAIFFSSLLLVIGEHSYYDPTSLDSLIRDLSMKDLKKQRTGYLSKVRLPSNFTGMEVSAVKIRSGTFFDKGANFSYFYIPPNVLPFPFVKRLAIVYQNLGNWSCDYYKIPGYTLVAPVVALLAYDATDLNRVGDDGLKFSISNDPIKVHFPWIKRVEEKDLTMKCVKFGENNLVQFWNITKLKTCFTLGDGKFSVVVENEGSDKEKKRKWRWWVIGFGVAIGLVVLGLIVYNVYKLIRDKRLKKMEVESDRGMPFDTTWVGDSKMPSASMTRTQPAIEHDYVP